MRSDYNNGDLHGAAWPGCLGSVYMQNYLILLEYTVKCRYNAVFGVQEIDRVIAVTAL